MGTEDQGVEAGDGPVLVPVQINVARPKQPVVARVVESRTVTNGRSNSFVRHFAIDLSGTPLAGTFRPGQAFGVLAPGLDARGRAHNVRLYSTSSPTWGEDGQGAVIATTVKRLIDERFAPALMGIDVHDRVAAHDACLALPLQA